MGLFQNHVIIVTDDLDRIERLYNDVVAIAKNTVPGGEYESLISPIVKGMRNDTCSFFIAPDGSKEGWVTSEDMDDIRERVVRYLTAQRTQFVHVTYGELGTSIVGDHNDPCFYLRKT